ncbi:hypothetical protein CC2G_010830 [Coprinopsis cinerea AmutBmut pab1-1]|nr:hypothetical protein CC2G_010830 [Coprinopsis cinerea AmutBmut pab1-1]
MAKGGRQKTKAKQAEEPTSRLSKAQTSASSKKKQGSNVRDEESEALFEQHAPPPTHHDGSATPAMTTRPMPGQDQDLGWPAPSDTGGGGGGWAGGMAGGWNQDWESPTNADFNTQGYPPPPVPSKSPAPFPQHNITTLGTIPEGSVRHSASIRSTDGPHDYGFQHYGDQRQGHDQHPNDHDQGNNLNTNPPASNLNTWEVPQTATTNTATPSVQIPSSPKANEMAVIQATAANASLALAEHQKSRQKATSASEAAKRTESKTANGNRDSFWSRTHQIAAENSRGIFYPEGAREDGDRDGFMSHGMHGAPGHGHHPPGMMREGSGGGTGPQISDNHLGKTRAAPINQMTTQPAWMQWGNPNKPRQQQAQPQPQHQYPGHGVPPPNSQPQTKHQKGPSWTKWGKMAPAHPPPPPPQQQQHYQPHRQHAFERYIPQSDDSSEDDEDEWEEVGDWGAGGGHGGGGGWGQPAHSRQGGHGWEHQGGVGRGHSIAPSSAGWGEQPRGRPRSGGGGGMHPAAAAMGRGRGGGGGWGGAPSVGGWGGAGAWDDASTVQGYDDPWGSNPHATKKAHHNHNSGAWGAAPAAHDGPWGGTVGGGGTSKKLKKSHHGHGHSMDGHGDGDGWGNSNAWGDGGGDGAWGGGQPIKEKEKDKKKKKKESGKWTSMWGGRGRDQDAGSGWGNQAGDNGWGAPIDDKKSKKKKKPSKKGVQEEADTGGGGGYDDWGGGGGWGDDGYDSESGAGWDPDHGGHPADKSWGAWETAGDSKPKKKGKVDDPWGASGGGRNSGAMWGGGPASQVADMGMQSKTMLHASKGMHNTPKPESHPLPNVPGAIQFLESGGEAIDVAKKAFYGSAKRPAKERFHWMFAPQNDQRVMAIMNYIQKASQYLAAFGLQKFLHSRERGALFVNAAFRLPGQLDQPVFDWLTFPELQSTMDKTLQESVAFYDPATVVIIFVFLASPTGNSVAIWRRKVPIPPAVTQVMQRDIGLVKTGLRPESEYVVYVEEIPPRDRRSKARPASKSAPHAPLPAQPTSIPVPIHAVQSHKPHVVVKKPSMHSASGKKATIVPATPASLAAAAAAASKAQAKGKGKVEVKKKRKWWQFFKGSS